MNKTTTFSAKFILTLGIFSMLFSTFGNNQGLAFNEKKLHQSKEKIESFPTDSSVLPVSDAKLKTASKQLNSPTSESLFNGSNLGDESEPNNSAATADLLAASESKIKGNIYVEGDVDYYSFNAVAGSRVYAATMTSFSASNSSDTVLDIIAPDGSTVLETDDNDGSFSSTSSSIAGTILSASGTYYIRVSASSQALQIRPYYLYLTVRSGLPTAETEANDTFPGQAMPNSGLASGSMSSTSDVDNFSFNLNAGDTVFMSLDFDPERDGTTWNGQLGFGNFGGEILTANDGNAASPNSEALFFTVKDSGIYGAQVSVPSGETTFGTYRLNVSVIPNLLSCTNYTQNTAQTINDLGLTSSTINVPSNSRIQKVRVFLNLTHTNMPDLDVHLVSPAGNDNGLFTDIGSSTHTAMNLGIDDDAALPIGVFPNVSGMIYQPESVFRLEWFRGENPAGNWRLDIRDDLAGNAGTLNNWTLQVCSEPFDGAVFVHQQDFETTNGNYTHSGTADEWEYGTPSFAPISNCYSGTKCWKTDLDNTYDANSSQDLISSNYSLSNVYGTIRLQWAMKYQFENASFDKAYVEISEVGNPSNSKRVWQWQGATMVNNVGSPASTINESAGWGIYTVDISEFSNKIVRVQFHVDGDTSIQYGGMAIDDVMIKNIPLTAASVSVSGKVLTANGNGLRNATVVLTDSLGNSRNAATGTFGNYRFENVSAGETYVLSVNSKRFQFSPQIITVQEEISEVNLIANE